MEVFRIETSEGAHIAIKTKSARILVLSHLPPSEWQDGDPAIAILGADVVKARVLVLADGKFNFDGWPDEIPWPCADDLESYRELIVILSCCFPSDAAPEN